MREDLVFFFSKGVLATLIDAYVVGTKRVEYPVRPFPKIFKTDVLISRMEYCHYNYKIKKLQISSAAKFA